MRQRCSYVHEITYVLHIVIHQAHKLLHFFHIGGFRPSAYSRYIIRVSVHSAIFYNMSQVFHMMFAKFTFLMLCFKLQCVELFKHFLEVSQVLLDGVRKHQDVIQIHRNTLVQQILESLIHYALKRGGRIRKT